MTEEFVPSYKWNLTDLAKVKSNGRKVFSCFACGGGSTMGYKLAGYEVVGANEIDPEMAWHYQKNHKPKHYFLEDIRKFKKRDDLPPELYDLDILDGSPPCSSFSMAGSREKGWGKKKVFREGQTEQTLDDLFFDFIELAQKLQPKVVIAENVKGMLQGNAKGYVKQIIGLFNVAGYDVQLFLLNAASMGVPQKRERVFFVCRRKDLALPELKLAFNQPGIPLSEALKGLDISDAASTAGRKDYAYWKMCRPGQKLSSVHPKGSFFSFMKLNPSEPSSTITANYHVLLHWEAPRILSTQELCAIGSYPMDYQFKTARTGGYMIGMSVPPLMTYGVANQINQQWFRAE
jgi:DNA (cytosine-5)-methyltransferase 1